MNGLKFLLDTNIVIGLLKGEKSVIQLLLDSKCMLSGCAVSQITRMELLSFPSLSKGEEQKIRKLLDAVTIIMLDEKIEKSVIEFRKSQGGRLPDAMIAATALYYQLRLLTLDKSLDKRVKLIAVESQH